MSVARYLFTRYSSNRKIGPMPVTTSHKNSCPDTCDLKNKSCYARFGPLAILWAKISYGSHPKQVSWDGLLEKIKSLPPGTVWRHNQAGDIEHDNGNIDSAKLEQLLKANEKLKGFTYTHHKLNSHNIKQLKKANEKGFTVNASIDRVSELDEFRDAGVPLVTIVPQDAPKVIFTEGGMRVVKCPASWRDDFTCSMCDLCMRPNRDFAIGFPIHGVGQNKWKA